MKPSHYLKASVLWFTFSVGLGMYMGVNQDFRLAHVHAHLNLLGWVSQAVVGLVWHSFPRLWTTRMALVQFTLFNGGLAAFMGAIADKLLSGHASLPVVAVGSSAAGLAIVLFAVQLLRQVRSGLDRSPAHGSF